jgi:ParB family chromosome partitioning protein
MNNQALPISTIEIPETRITSYFDQDIYEEFKKTIAKAGVIEPVVVVKVESKYYLVDGLHRLQEAKAKGDATINAVILPGATKDIFLTNLFLNVMRGRTKVSEMRKVLELLVDDFHMNVNQISTKTGLTKQYIIDLVKIGELPDEILEAFDVGQISKGSALALAELNDPEQQLRVFAQISGRNVSVKDVQDIVKLIREEKHDIQPPAHGDDHEPPAAGKEVHCDICHKPFGIKWLRPVLVCADCELANKELLGTKEEEQ